MPTEKKEQESNSILNVFKRAFGSSSEEEAVAGPAPSSKVPATHVDRPQSNLAPPGPTEIPSVVPVFPLRNSCLFPGSIIPIDFGRASSIKLVNDCIAEESPIIVVLSQRDAAVESPGPEDLYTVGCAARILKVIKVAKDNYTVILQGLSRIRVLSYESVEPYLRCQVRAFPDPETSSAELSGLTANLKDLAKQVIKQLPELPKEAAELVDSTMAPGLLADLLASNIDVMVAEKQAILESFDRTARILKVMEILSRQLETLQVRDKINNQVQEKMGRNQREYVLRQQLKAIEEELGEGQENSELRRRLQSARFPEPVRVIAEQELSRLLHLGHETTEYHTVYKYLDWLAALPWSSASALSVDPRRAEEMLNKVHHGAERVKEWLLEELAVAKLKKGSPSHALCFVGPPGVGKTTLGEAIAKALGRPFVAISLGGLQDEAMIRGIPRFYSGATPGLLARALRDAGAPNPVILLDEIDKLDVGTRGDPRAALLEAIDPARGYRIVDSYLQMPVDLSQVLFIGTANNASDIFAPLRSRLRLIEFWGYDFHEKLEIARTHLWPKCLDAHGLSPELLRIDDDSLRRIIRYYTREAGVRDLEQRLSAICRQVAKKIAEARMRNIDHRVDLKESVLPSYLGDAVYFPYAEAHRSQIGRAHVAAITHQGAMVCPIDCIALAHGETRPFVTGDGEAVTRELCLMAASLVDNGDRRWFGQRRVSRSAFHVHLHGGLRSEEETWASGAALLLAMLSAASSSLVPQDLAVMGRISLLGEIGGVPNIHAKVMAAQRFGVRRMLVSAENRNDVRSLPARTREDISFEYISDIDELLHHTILPLASRKPASTAEDTNAFDE